jgi:hypothetical protein
MATSAVTNVGALDIGKYLKIVSKGGVYNNLPEDSTMWENILKKKKGVDEGRELRYLLRSAYGASAANFVAVGGGAYPNAQKSALNEGTAQYKDFALTIEVQRDVIERATSDFSRYGEPLAEEIRSKTITLSRQLSASIYADGTGVLAQATGAGTISAGQIVLPIGSSSTSKGFIGWLEYGDLVVAATLAGVQTNPTVASGTFAWFQVTDKDRANSTVTLQAQNSAGAALTVTVTNILNTMVLYKLNSQINDLASVATTDDYNSLSFYFPGLQSLAAADGRKVNGINMTGAIKGTQRDVGGQPIDSSDFQKLMSQVKLNVGANRYKYTRAMMAWETLDALVESRETDRRFISIKDNKRGVDVLGYVHGKDTLIFEADEFCPTQAIWCCPEGDVLQFYGADFEFVEPQAGQKFMLKPNASGHDRVIRAYMEGHGVLTCVHPAAVGLITNFTVA